MKTINTISDTLGYTLDTYSTFNPDDRLDDDAELGEYGVDYDFDHTAYVADLANLQADILNKACAGNSIFKAGTATGSYSPREYNFKTDNSELLIEFNDKLLMAYIVKHKDEFKQYLKDNFTSYDGFWSFVPNTWAEFYAETKELDGQNDSDRNWSIMLGWYLKREVLTVDDYLESMWDEMTECIYNNVIDVKKEA